jgi:hypothetical protein
MPGLFEDIIEGQASAAKGAAGGGRLALQEFFKRIGAHAQRFTDAASTFQSGGDIGPLMEEVLNFSPGGVGGILGPIRNKAQKKAVSALFRADPEVLQMVQADPRTMQIRVPEDIMSRTPKPPPKDADIGEFTKYIARIVDRTQDLFGKLNESFATHQFINPMRSEIAVNPRTLRGKTPITGRTYPEQLTKGALAPLPDLPSAMLHESGHFLIDPKVRKMTQPEALYTASTLEPYVGNIGDAAITKMGSEGALAGDVAHEAIAYSLQNLNQLQKFNPEFAQRYRHLKDLMKSWKPDETDLATEMIRDALRGAEIPPPRSTR